MDGQVYVPVQANVSTYTTRAVTSGNVVTSGFLISWTFSGGITGGGWNSPRYVQPVEGDVEATNQAISTAYRTDDFSADLKDLIVLSDRKCATWA